MTAPGAGTFEQGFYEATQAISQGIEEVQTNYKLLEERLNTALKFIFVPAISNGIIFAFERLNELMHEFTDILQRLITEPGYPPALFRVGDMWEKNVGTILSKQAAFMSPDTRAADNSFVGSAARAYHDAAEAQRLATQSFSPLSSDMKSALHDLAHSQILFLIAIGATVATFAVTMVAAAASAGTGVGAPAAPPIAVTGAAAAITMLLATAPIIYDAYAGAMGAFETMRTQIADSEGMPDEWPKIGERITQPRKPWQVATD